MCDEGLLWVNSRPQATSEPRSVDPPIADVRRLRREVPLRLAGSLRRAGEARSERSARGIAGLPIGEISFRFLLDNAAMMSEEARSAVYVV